MIRPERKSVSWMKENLLKFSKDGQYVQYLFEGAFENAKA